MKSEHLYPYVLKRKWYTKIHRNVTIKLYSLKPEDPADEIANKLHVVGVVGVGISVYVRCIISIV